MLLPLICWGHRFKSHPAPPSPTHTPRLLCLISINKFLGKLQFQYSMPQSSLSPTRITCLFTTLPFSINGSYSKEKSIVILDFSFSYLPHSILHWSYWFYFLTLLESIHLSPPLGNHSKLLWISLLIISYSLSSFLSNYSPHSKQNVALTQIW